METLDIKQAAEFLGISPRALKDLCRERKITFMKINKRHWQFRMSALVEYQERVTVRRKSVYDAEVAR